MNDPPRLPLVKDEIFRKLKSHVAIMAAIDAELLVFLFTASMLSSDMFREKIKLIK